MKKKIILPFIILMLMIATLGLASCVNDKDAPTAVTVTMYIGETKYENISGYTNENLFDHLSKICTDNNLNIAYTGSNYGAYITEIGNLKAGASTFIAIYASDESIKDVSAYATTKDIDGKTLFTAGIGASSIKLIDGGVYAFVLSSF